MDGRDDGTSSSDQQWAACWARWVMGPSVRPMAPMSSVPGLAAPVDGARLPPAIDTKPEKSRPGRERPALAGEHHGPHGGVTGQPGAGVDQGGEHVAVEGR
jgi:hypothetical protein